MIKILERHIETRLRRKLLALGCKCEKFTSPQRRSVPDRIVSAMGGKLWYVELKAPGKKPTPSQFRDHEKRREMGFDVRVIDSYDGVDTFVKEVEAYLIERLL